MESPFYFLYEIDGTSSERVNSSPTKHNLSLLVYMYLTFLTNYTLINVFPKHPGERGQNGFMALAHKLRKCLAKVRSCFLQVVMRYLAEHVMYLMCTYIVDEIVNKSIMSINRGELASNKVPFFISIPWHIFL